MFVFLVSVQGGSFTTLKSCESLLSSVLFSTVTKPQYDTVLPIIFIMFVVSQKYPIAKCKRRKSSHSDDKTDDDDDGSWSAGF